MEQSRATSQGISYTVELQEPVKKAGSNKSRPHTETRANISTAAKTVLAMNSQVRKDMQLRENDSTT